MIRPSLYALMFVWASGAASVVAHAQDGAGARTSVVRLHPALDDIVSPEAHVEPLADMPGQSTREGPVWIRSGRYLIYTVRNGNRAKGSTPATDSDIIKWDPRDGSVSVLVKGLKSDGNTVDRKGRIVGAVNIGDGAIVRVEKNGSRTMLADRFEGQPINPNDLVYRKDGSLYFTSPPRYGNDTDIPSVYMLKGGRLIRLSPSPQAQVPHPGGLGFSPDEKFLYVVDNPRILKFAVARDGSIANGSVFFDMQGPEPLDNFPDGLKVDTRGNVYVTGPGGVWILSPEGRHVGTILEPHRPANLAFGGDDGRTLFITSRPGLYRIALKVAGPLP